MITKGDNKIVDLKGTINNEGNLFRKIIDSFEQGFNETGWSTLIQKEDGFNFTWSIHKNGHIRFWVRMNLELFLDYFFFILKQRTKISRPEFLELITSLKYTANDTLVYIYNPINENIKIIEKPKKRSIDPLLKIMVKGENKLQDTLFKYPYLIEEGFSAIDKEFHTNVGRIDLICKDKAGNYVIIELKKVNSGDKVLGQLQRYMGWAIEHLAHGNKDSVRGIIILFQQNKKLKYAIKACKNISLKYYRFKLIISDNPIERIT